MIDTSNTIIRIVARKLNVQEEVIKKVHDYYWKEGVKKAMRSGEHTAIRVAKLGTFMVSRRKLYKLIPKYIAYIRYLGFKDTKSFKRSSKEDAIAKYKKDLKLLLNRRDDLAKLFNQNIKNRQDVKLLKTSLGE